MMDGDAVKTKISLTQDESLSDAARGSLQNFVASLTVPQKVELSAKGNREVRKLLSRDPSSLVARAIITSPRLAELDIMDYAASPVTHEEILRAIGENREWMSNPKILSLIVANPKTPPPVALRLMGRLSVNELGVLQRNANASALVRREAKRLVQIKRG
ncbi:MAG TPA: hypothetical protein VIU29_03035 [Candidatus Deferrimicrobiaceae bacterium]